MTKQGRLFLFTANAAPAGGRVQKGTAPSALTTRRAPSLYASVESKHAVLHHSCFGQIKAAVLIFNFCHYAPSALTNCPVGRVPARPVLPYIIPHGATFAASAFVLQPFKAPCSFPGASWCYKGIQWAGYLKHGIVVWHLSEVNGKQARQWPFNSPENL